MTYALQIPKHPRQQWRIPLLVLWYSVLFPVCNVTKYYVPTVRVNEGRLRLSLLVKILHCQRQKCPPSKTLTGRLPVRHLGAPQAWRWGSTSSGLSRCDKYEWADVSKERSAFTLGTVQNSRLRGCGVNKLPSSRKGNTFHTASRNDWQIVQLHQLRRKGSKLSQGTAPAHAPRLDKPRKIPVGIQTQHLSDKSDPQPLGKHSRKPNFLTECNKPLFEGKSRTLCKNIRFYSHSQDLGSSVRFDGRQ